MNTNGMSNSIHKGEDATHRLMDELSDEDRFVPVALSLAVCEAEAIDEKISLEESEEVKAGILEDADNDYGELNEESRWTPVALRLARSGNGTE